jgi:hypothetical protein
VLRMSWGGITGTPFDVLFPNSAAVFSTLSTTRWISSPERLASSVCVDASVERAWIAAMREGWRCVYDRVRSGSGDFRVGKGVVERECCCLGGGRRAGRRSTSSVMSFLAPESSSWSSDAV